MRKKSFFVLLTWLFLVVVLPAEALTVRAPDHVSLGVPFSVEVSGDETLTGVEVRWMGRIVSLENVVTPEKKFFRTALVCPPPMRKEGREIMVLIVTRKDRVLNLPWQVSVKARSFPSTRLTVAPGKAVPPQKVRERLVREGREAAKALGTETFPCRWSLPLVRPVKGVVTSPYGTERLFNGTTCSRHTGIDFRAAPGTSIRAVADGKVVLTGDRYFSGRSVFVNHGGGIVSFYGHMSKISVRTGQSVKGGEVLGLSGATGRVTGPHLHFGLGVHGQMADAMSLFGEDRQTFESACREIEVE